jgi:acyl-CoA synthetase (NDP forming)
MSGWSPERVTGGVAGSGATVSLGQAVWHPRSVALIGASADPAKNSGRPLRYLRAARYPGRVYPVNSVRNEVQGELAWPSLAALPEVPDHAYVLVPTDRALVALAECAELGVPVVTVMADGVIGYPDRVERLWAALRGSQTRLVGPSSLGVVSVPDRLTLTANAAFAEAELPVGGVLVASQSGGAIGALLSRGKAAGIGFAGLISTGNEIDVSLGELCQSTVDDPAVSSYALFLESIAHTGRLREFAVAAARRGKPVLAYKLGRSQVAAELSVTHTGALADDDSVAEALLAELGIGRVRQFETLLEGQLLATQMPVPTCPRVGVVTTTGGGGAMAVDALAAGGIDVRPPSAATAAALDRHGIEPGSGALIDLTLAGTRSEVMRAALSVMLSADDFDLVVAVPGSSARFHPELAVQPIIDCARLGTPVAAFVVPDAPEALSLLRAAGVAAFRTPEALADAVQACARREPARERVTARPTPAYAPARILDEAASYQVIEAAGIPVARHVILDAHERPGELPVPGPVAVKALMADLTHKSDVGGVRLGITTAAELQAAMAEIAEAMAAHGMTLSQVLVQQMVSSLGEVMIGARRDRTAGLVVVLAAGGVLAELYDDRAVRLGPLELSDAALMLGEVRALRALSGYRGSQPGNLGAVADALMRLSALIAEQPDIDEVEINPLLVRADGVVAVDAVVRCRCGGQG